MSQSSSSSSSSSLSLINLISCDNRTFGVEKEVAMQSQVLKAMLENVDDSDTGGQRNDTIPLKNEHLTGDVLEKVIEWIEHHLEMEMEEDEEEETEAMAMKWDEDFVKGLGEPKGLLSDVLMAANYLDIKGLLDICVKAVANKIRGKGACEIQEMFSLQVGGKSEKGEVENPAETQTVSSDSKDGNI